MDLYKQRHCETTSRIVRPEQLMPSQTVVKAPSMFKDSQGQDQLLIGPKKRTLYESSDAAR